MSFLAGIPIIGDFIDKIGEAIDRNITTDDERLRAKAEMMALAGPVIQALVQAQGTFDQLRVQLQIAEVQSGDRLVRWTRPLMTWITFGFWMFCVITANPNVNEAFYAFGLIGGLFSATRGMEKVASRYANGHNGTNGK